MANTSSAKKAQRVAARRRLFNARLKRAIHETAKAFQKSPSASSLALYQQALDKAAKHGTIAHNRAARTKSRMAKRLAAAGKK